MKSWAQRGCMALVLATTWGTGRHAEAQELLGGRPDLSWIEQAELSLSASFQPPEDIGAERQAGDVGLSLGGRGLIIRPGTQFQARGEVRRAAGGQGLLLEGLDIAIEPYLRIRDVVWRKDIGIAALHLGPEGIAVEAVLLDLPLLNRIPGVRRLATWKKRFVLEAFEPLADGPGVRLRIRGLPDIELRIDAQRHLLVRGKDVAQIPADLPIDFLQRLRFPLDLEALLADLAPLLKSTTTDTHIDRGDQAGASRYLALWSRFQVTAQVSLPDGKLSAEARGERQPSGDAGLLRQTVSVDLSIAGGLPERLRLPIAPGDVELELGERVAFRADGETRTPVNAKLGWSEAISATSWRGLTRMTLPLESAQVDLGGAKIAVDGPVQVEVSARDFFRADGSRPILADFALAVAPGSAIRLHSPQADGTHVDVAFDPEGRRVGILRGQARLKLDGAGGVTIKAISVRELTIVGRDIRTIFPETLRFDADAVAVTFHDLLVDYRDSPIDAVPDVRWSRFSVAGGAGGVQWLSPMQEPPAATAKDKPVAPPEALGLIERLRGATRAGGE